MATGGSRQKNEATAQHIVRIFDVADEPLETLLPIAGYDRVPLVSLGEAAEHLVPILPLIQTYVHVAKQRCKQPVDGLTQDESAAIMLYTMGWQPINECLYHVLNATLRAKDRAKLIPWFPYLRLVLNGLFRLPSVPRTVFRGVKLDLIAEYAKDETIIWWGFASCTTQMNVLQSKLFLGETGTRMMFTIECFNGKDIRKHSYLTSEDETLILPATHFKVVGNLKQGDLYCIHLKEIKPAFPLLQPLIIPIAPIIISQTTSNTQWNPDGMTVAGGNGRGNQLNQLNSPHGICIDNDNQSIYIVDCWNDRIVKWQLNTPISQVVAGGNGRGNQMNQLHHPTDVIIDKNNNSLIICDRENRRVVEWSLQNDTQHGQTIISNIDCYSQTMDKNGYIYVCDCEKNEVRRWKRGETNGTIVAGGNGEGNRLNQLNHPTFIFVDQEDAIYVSDHFNHRVMKWIKGANEGIIIAGGRGKGNQSILLDCPTGITVDHSSNVYIADYGNHRIMCWAKGSKEGQIIVGGYGKGQQSNQLSCPKGLSFDRKGNLYVADSWYHRIQKFVLK